jgi:hypothetical protein
MAQQLKPVRLTSLVDELDEWEVTRRIRIRSEPRKPQGEHHRRDTDPVIRKHLSESNPGQSWRLLK